MRWVWIGLIFLSMVSCGGSATLFTDEVFRASAPEITQAWASLPFFYDARIKNLTQDTALRVLQEELKNAAPGFRALLGMNLTREERKNLIETYPSTRLVFFVPEKNSDGYPTITVNEQEAWDAVTKAALAKSPGLTGFALFPSDVSESQVLAFDQTWAAGGGRELRHFLGTRPDNWGAESGMVFQWMGPEGDELVQNLPPTVLVHGNPGLVRAPGAEGFHWRLRTDALPTFLWEAAKSSGKKAYFLPLETGFDDR